MQNSETKNDKRVFFVDTDVRVLKYGVKIKPLVISNDSLSIAKKGLNLGFKHYMTDPAILIEMAVSPTYTPDSFGLQKEPRKKFQNLDVEFEKIPFSKINKISTRKLITCDLVIDLFYENNQKISFFCVNEFNTVNEKTQKLFDILNQKIAK